MTNETNQSTTRNFAQAQASSRAKLAERGGKRIDVRLEADTIAELQTLKERLGVETDKEAIAFAIAYARENRY